ncbi:MULTISPECIES: hypothetical protein [unclassified Streptomyces]|uniref:hypothetical protein n=1 Tax=unclassified Streptomyces TaxID=2593676 RepID=UPI002DD85E69|nr:MULTISPECIES: hypothetical protein [unclassified Streptomyces]WSA96600.1 hypothetical protein OIE63_37385 [Streptomyces sp. NBC_01795]WSB81014.1 hypothetical protein OHB04_38500 [Streptomyces sp. NBC_01775]WSS10775.1 hypothetical protein OG533_01755 [Streptomyces sp. NBC_01186]WSS39474.1 hypothetical protein OG220_01795 [Streptomyces sp. NBC_01187]
MTGRLRPRSGAADPAADPAADDDLDHGVRFLASLPLHAGRDTATLRRWAAAAAEFGASLPLAPEDPAVRVVERDGGLENGLLARYTSRPPAVELYTDALAEAERLIDAYGWRAWFPPGSVRAAALAHEAVHGRLHHGPGRAALKRSLGHTALRLGRLRVPAHVAGAEELAAHAYAQAVCGLGRSPLLLSAALAASTAPPREKK